MSWIRDFCSYAPGNRRFSVEKQRAARSGSRLPLATALVVLVLLSAAPSFGQRRARRISLPPPTVHQIQLLSVSAPQSTATGTRVSFVLEITGQRLGSAREQVGVWLLTPDGAEAAENIRILAHDPGKLIFTAAAPPGSYNVKLLVRGVQVNTTGFPVPLNPPASAPPPVSAPKEFEIKYQTYQSAEYPNLWTLVITNDAAGFSVNRNHHQVSLVPSGASNIQIQSSDLRQLVLTFMAPEKFEVKEVIVTVFDSSDLDTRRALAMSKPFVNKKPAIDPRQPTITTARVLYLNRSKGFGRLLIEGSGFGEYEAAPLSSSNYLQCCAPRYADALRKASSKYSRELQVEIGNRVTGLRRLQRNWQDWQAKIKQLVRVQILPRRTSVNEPPLRIEDIIITYLDDKLMDVYFEFEYYEGYSQPFRVDRVVVTVNKPKAENAPPTAAGAGSQTASTTADSKQTYQVAYDLEPKRNDKLEFSYAIMDQDEANHVLGRGIADNYYVIQLSVINKGENKVAIPLAGIKAEIEWATGEIEDPNLIIYAEGPEVLPPTPMSFVAHSFDAYNKTVGKRAKLFNVLDGVTTLGAALIPIFGPGFKDGHVIFTGGLIPGIHKAVGDLSGQQLAALTALSWQDVEVVAGKGGRTDKYIYVQRGEQVFTPPTARGTQSSTNSSSSISTIVRKRIMSVVGLDLTGIEVIEAKPQQATPASKVAGQTTP